MMEIMFAMLILVVVILGLLGMLGSVLRSQSEGRIYEKVSIAANTVFGQAGQAISEDFEKSLVPDVFASGRQPVTGLEEEISFEISEQREKDDLKRVDITLYWKDKDGQEHQKTLSTKFLKGV
jgi:hypothetical protein